MVYLNPRQKTILRYLAAKKDWVKSHEMAVILGVSDRTVRNDIAYINSLVEGEENVIISHRKGYRINDDDKARKMLVEDNSDIPNDPDERANFLLKKLVFEKRGLNIYQLAEEIMVSESTIASDLKRLNKILKEYGRDLSVVRKSNEIFLEGSEKEKRSLLSELLFNETNHSYFNLTKYKRYFKDIDLITIQKYLIETVKKYDFLLNEVALVNLLVHIAITVERIKNKNFLEVCLDFEKTANTVECEIAKELCAKLEDEFKVKFPPEEVLYISYLILGRRKIMNTFVDREELKRLVEPYYISLTQLLLDSLASEYGIDFTHDDMLFTGMCLHIKIMHERIKNRMSLRNPLLEDLKMRYPFIFEIAVFLSSEFSRLTGEKVKEDEIGFIALHLGAAFQRHREKQYLPKRAIIVCPTGYTTSHLLLSKINSEYKGRIEIIEVLPLMELDKIETKQPDFVFTTVSLERDFSIPVIRISPFLDEKDRQLINRALNTDGVGNKVTWLCFEIEKFFRQELFVNNLAFNDKFQVIDFMANELYDKGYVPKNYYELVMEREKLSSTSFGNLVAIPHPIIMNAYETVISVAILNKPILWGNYYVQLVLMFAIKAGDRKNLDYFYNHIVEVIDDAKKVKFLTDSKDFMDFKSRLISLFSGNE